MKCMEEIQARIRECEKLIAELENVRSDHEVVSDYFKLGLNEKIAQYRKEIRELEPHLAVKSVTLGVKNADGDEQS